MNKKKVIIICCIIVVIAIILIILRNYVFGFKMKDTVEFIKLGNNMENITLSAYSIMTEETVEITDKEDVKRILELVKDVKVKKEIFSTITGGIDFIVQNDEDGKEFRLFVGVGLVTINNKQYIPQGDYNSTVRIQIEEILKKYVDLEDFKIA